MFTGRGQLFSGRNACEWDRYMYMRMLRTPAWTTWALRILTYICEGMEDDMYSTGISLGTGHMGPWFTSRNILPQNGHLSRFFLALFTMYSSMLGRKQRSWIEPAQRSRGVHTWYHIEKDHVGESWGVLFTIGRVEKFTHACANYTGLEFFFN